MLLWRDYVRKLKSIEHQNIVGIWPQGERAGSTSKDYSRHGHDGAYTAVTLGGVGVPGSGLTSAGYDGATSFNDIHSAGLANDNLLSNPGFETAGAGDPDFWANWSETVGGTAALANEAVVIHEGSDAAKMTAGNNQALVRQDITVVSGKKYRLRFWTRGDGTNQGRYKIYDNDNSVYTVEENTGVAGAAYAAVVKEFTAPAGCTSMAVLLLSARAAGIAYFDACEVRCMDGFLGDEGTLLAWAKVSAAGVWTDATWRFMVGLQVDVNNRIYIAKSQAVNSIRYRYGADSVMEDVDTAGETATGWMVVGITWDKAANQFIAYRDGAQEGAIQAIAGTWVGDLVAAATTIGAQTTVPAAVWSGEIGPVALWNKALSADQIAYLSKV